MVARVIHISFFCKHKQREKIQQFLSAWIRRSFVFLSLMKSDHNVGVYMS